MARRLGLDADRERKLQNIIKSERKRREEEMSDENDWTRLAMSLDAIRETLLDGTHGVLAGSDSVTVLTDTRVQTAIELRRAQKQCAAYGETHEYSRKEVAA